MKSGGSSMHTFLKEGLCHRIHLSKTTKIPDTRLICEKSEFDAMLCSTAFKRYPNFFRWSLVRHPVPRAVSSWAMASQILQKGAPKVGFNAWAVNTTALRTKVWDMHWWPQADFLLDQRGCPLYDFVGTLGRGLARDMEVVLQRIGAPGLWERYRGGGLPRVFASQDAVREAAYRNVSAAALAALGQRYRADLEAFGFRMDGWREEGYA
jgi:hypothetical protein